MNKTRISRNRSLLVHRSLALSVAVVGAFLVVTAPAVVHTDQMRDSAVPQAQVLALSESHASGSAIIQSQSHRPVALAQFGGRGGGGGGRGGGGRGGGRGGGGFGGGGGGQGGFGGGGQGGGGQGGGGFGGGGGGQNGGQGGVAIDPRIQLKVDASGSLDEKRKQATTKKPTKGNFAADQ